MTDSAHGCLYISHVLTLPYRVGPELCDPSFLLKLIVMPGVCLYRASLTLEAIMLRLSSITVVLFLSGCTAFTNLHQKYQGSEDSPYYASTR